MEDLGLTITLQKKQPYDITKTSMISLETIKKKLSLFFIAYMLLTTAVTGGNTGKDLSFKARVQVEMGIDSLERRFYKPEFRFDLPLKFAALFSEISYYQVTNGRLQGRIDYWVVVGLEKKLGDKLKLETRLNHMCRHIASRENPVIFDLNEVIGKLRLLNKTFKLGFGCGTYTGGSAHYKNLLQLEGEVPHILGSEVSFKGRFKLVDFEEILHEAELFISLSKSTDLFIRNSRDYELKNRTYIGVRMKSQGKVGKYIDSLNMSAGIYPFYKSHKLSVEGEFRLAFFRQPRRRVMVSVHFIAPISRGNSFFKEFYPEEMIYPISLQYQRKIKESLFLAWYSRYHVSMPLDEDREFSASLAGGMALKNQWDFERLRKPVRFDIYAGYNFKHKFEMGAKLGVSFVKNDGFNVGSDFGFDVNGEKLTASFRLFVDYGRAVTVRPFVGVEKIQYSDSPQPSVNKCIIGIRVFRWFN